MIGAAALPGGLRPGSLRIPYYEATHKVIPGSEAILTSPIGSLPRFLQNYADTVADMIARGEDEDTPDGMALSSMNGTQQSKGASQYASSKRRRKRHFHHAQAIELAMAEEERLKDAMAAMERIEHLETHIHGVLGHLEEIKRNILSLFLSDAKEMFEPRQDFENDLED